MVPNEEKCWNGKWVLGRTPSFGGDDGDGGERDWRPHLCEGGEGVMERDLFVPF